MRILGWITSKLVDDYKLALKWRSTQIVTAGAIFSAVAFSLSLSSAGMQFIGVFGLRLTLLLCFVIFVCAFIGRIWKQSPSQGDDQGQSGP